MKQVFKKTLLAAVIASASGGAFAANGDLTVDSVFDYSKQGLSLLTATAVEPTDAINYELGLAYTVGQRILLTFTTGSLPSTGHGLPATITTDNGTNDTVFTLTNVSDDVATYVATALVSTGSSAGDNFVVGPVNLNASAIAAGDVEVTISALDALAQPYDSIGGIKKVTITESSDQFGAFTVTAGTNSFNTTIDVSNNRNSFVGALNDAFIFSFANDALLVDDADIAGGTLVINGDFSGFDFATGSTEVTSANGTLAYDATKQELTVSYTGVTVGDTLTFTPPTAADELITLNAQKFTGDFTVNFDVTGSGTTPAGTEQLASNQELGEWDLNGSVVNVPYLPFGENISQILYVTNQGTLTGDISVVGFDEEGMTYDLGVIGEASAGAVTKITDEVVQGLLAADFDSGKIALTVTVNVPDSDITVYAAYKVGDDRAFVNTSQYKGVE